MILLYLVARCRFEKKSGNIKNCERWSDMLNEMFPEIALLTRVGKVYIPKYLLSIRVLLFLQFLVDKESKVVVN